MSCTQKVLRNRGAAPPPPSKKKKTGTFWLGPVGPMGPVGPGFGTWGPGPGVGLGT